MKKSIRKQIFDKYNGKCAYCGVELKKGWHVDEKEPCVRIFELMPSYTSGGKWIPAKRVWTGKYEFPERLHIDNQMPACASCNINKHSESLEQFRKNIAAYMKHLNEISTQYKIAKRYGLIQETNIEVEFYFEKINSALKSTTTD